MPTLSPASWQSYAITAVFFACGPVCFAGAVFIWRMWKQWQPVALSVMMGLSSPLFAFQYGRVVGIWSPVLQSSELRPSLLLFGCTFFLFACGFAYSFQHIRAATQEAMISAAEADRVKDDFTMIMLHEMNTPISVIKGYLDMLLQQEIPDDLQAMITGIERGLQRLLIHSLYISVLEQRPSITVFNLDNVVTEAINDPAIWVATHHEPGAVTIEHLPQPVEIEADEKKLRAAIFELIHNALKVSKAGDTVSVRASIPQRTPNMICISVQDWDGGIELKDQQRIWERGEQIYGELNKRPLEGSGLGLYMVRHVARVHKGYASLDASAIGVGSVFSICIPRRAV